MDVPEQNFPGRNEKENAESGSSNKKTFTKRAGTTDKGKDFENLMVTNLVLRLMRDNSVKDFNVWSNDQDFGEFDDVIVEIEASDGSRQKYALQLKHVSKETKKLSIEALKEEEGNFGLNKYFQSFTKSRKTLCNYQLILLTTLDSNLSENQEIQLNGCNNEMIYARIIESTVVPILNTSTNEKFQACYQFEIIRIETTTTSTIVNEYDRFFKNFFLYTNQMNADDLKTNIISEMKKMFVCSSAVSEKFLNFISDWSLRDGTKEKLHLKMIQKVIALYSVAPYILPISFCDVTKNEKLLRKAIDRFDVCVVKKGLGEKVARLWGDALDGLEEKEVGIANRNYQILDKFDISKITEEGCNEDFTKLLWLINKCPLIVDANPMTFEAVKLCRDRKFILLGDNINERFLETRLVFQRLSDLKAHSEIFKEMNEAFKYSLPEGEVTLQKLVERDENFNHVVTTNELIMMLDRSFTIKQESEKLSSSYIIRSLSKIIVDLTFLKYIDKDTLILISAFTEYEDIFHPIKKYNPIYLDEDLKPMADEVSQDQGYIYVTRKMCSQEEFLTLCQQDKKRKSFHHFRIWNGLLEWTKSVNDINIFQKHFTGGHFASTEERELWETASWNNIHLIAGDPGVGKSCLMRNLKNIFSEIMFTILFSPHDIKEICKHHQTQIQNEEFILNLKCSNYKEFDRCVLQLLFKKKQVMFLWDALDEISEDIDCDNNLSIILDVIQNFSKRGIVQWLTCRRHIKNIIEDKFCVCSREMLLFTEEQQISFIKERIRYVCPDDKNLDETAIKIKNNVALTKYGNMLSIPIQIYMLTEFCIQDNKYSDKLETMFPLTDLYQYYVEEKINFYYKDKVMMDTIQNNQLKHTQNNHIKQYQKAAMKAIFDGQFLERLNIDCDDFLNDMKQEGDCFGFITEVANETHKPVFADISYAEYFAATYLFKRKGANLAEILFKQKYSNVRFFFDMLLAKDCPAHVAVLYKNITHLQNYSDSVHQQDLGGRNVLHLACSWGERYPQLHFNSVDKIYVLENELCSVKAESSDYLNLIANLTKIFDVHQIDGMYNMTALEYAEKSDCLMALAVIVDECNIEYFSTKDDNFNYSVLYYSVKFGMEKFVVLFKNYVKHIRSEDYKTLLRLASESNHQEVVDLLVKFELDYHTSDSKYENTDV